MQVLSQSIPPGESEAPKSILIEDARLNIVPDTYPNLYNKTPFGFTHNLHLLDVFQFDSLCELASKYSAAGTGYYVAGNAPKPGASFFSASVGNLLPHEAIHQLEEKRLRILFKSPENHDARLLRLRNLLLEQVLDLRGDFGWERLVRVESGLLISSPSTITPIHFDPEINFFHQIEGDKVYHAYSPNDVSEPDLERFYVRDLTSIGRLEMEQRHAENEHVFHLGPGKGFHQPQNSPHWVETCATTSVSYTLVLETDVSRALGRTRAFNHYERKLGLKPAPPGTHPSLDTLKAQAVEPYLLGRKFFGKLWG